MEKRVYELNIAGQTMRYLLRDPETANCFPNPLRVCGSKEYDVTLTEADVKQSREQYPRAETEAWREYEMLVWPTASFLLRRSACIVHSVSINWLGKAWLLCAPSGTGKSTQFCRWRQIGGTDVRLINGDMSAVSLEPDGELLVWSTPWHGKEGWIGDPGPVPLGGMIFLEQSKTNSLQRLTSGEAVQRIIDSICSNPESTQDVFRYAAMAEEILQYPLWLLKNCGDTAAAQMIMEAIRAERSKDE